MGVALDTLGNLYVSGRGAGFDYIDKIAACGSPSSNQSANPPALGDCFVYPSPAKGGHATVSYNMAEQGKVELRIWNEKAELVDAVTDSKPAGVQTTPFTIAGFATGVYFYSVALNYDSGKSTMISPKKFVVIH